MASKTFTAVWQPWGPALSSFEDLQTGSGLGVDYSEGVDTRWNGKVVLGPKITMIDCTAAGGTTANANGQALSNGMNATKYIYVIRGTKWAKIKASDMSLVSDGTETALAEAATSILYTKNAAGTEELSIGMDNTAYEVITTVSGGATDTHAANASSVINAIMDYGSPANTVAGLGRAGAAGSAENTVRQNVITGTVTMATPTWSTKAAITGEAFTFTGFALDANYWIVGTSNGPYFLDSDFTEFRPEIDELPNDPQNCLQMAKWVYLGVIVPLANGMRYQKNVYNGASIGPERFPFNTSPIMGMVTGVAGSDRWLYANVYNPVTGNTYLCACRPPQPGERSFGVPINYYPLAKLTSRSNYLQNIGKYGARTNDTLMGGHGSDAFWMTMGRLTREIDDTEYRYALSGTLYLTELRRYPHQMKKVKWIELETSGCSSTKTITVSVVTQDERGLSKTTQIGGAIKTNGIQRLRVPVGEELSSRRLKLQIAFASDDATASPAITDLIQMGFELLPMSVDGASLEDE